MADTGIFATTAEVQRKTGANASSTSNVEAYINQFMTEVESLINTTTRVNWSDLYSGLNADVKGILKMAASASAAMMVIQYDMGGYSQREAETMLDVLNNEYTIAIAQLKEQAQKGFIENA
tara:strand:+ start:927 stop:1289 length:363 start_codon:yes stop_codon:yes gene_type:complete